MTERNENRAMPMASGFASLARELENTEEAGEEIENAEAEIECRAFGCTPWRLASVATCIRRFPPLANARLGIWTVTY
jgi:hypothetical protein